MPCLECATGVVRAEIGISRERHPPLRSPSALNRYILLSRPATSTTVSLRDASVGPRGRLLEDNTDAVSHPLDPATPWRIANASPPHIPQAVSP